MANLPRFGRTWQRFSSMPRPGTASRPEFQPTTTDPEISPAAPATATNIYQTSPVRERSSRFSSPVKKYSSPVKKFSSPPSSPKYRAATTATSPIKSPSPIQRYDRYDGERRSTSVTTSPKTFKPSHRSPPLSPAKPKYSVPAAVPSLSPLTLPRSEPRYEPEPIRSRSPPQVTSNFQTFNLIHHTDL